MRNLWNYVLGLWVIGMGLGVSAPAQAATSNGPYYATPSWDQTLPVATRFIILSNFASAAVLDRNTGLVWEKAPAATQFVWDTARLACINKNVGGQKGWRLPSIPELASLVDPAVAFPGLSLPPGHPFTNVELTRYWSATTDVENPLRAWVVFFIDSFVAPVTKTVGSLAWCVRGGMNADQY